MESHSVLAKRNFLVSSYGTGEKIKIPGKSQREPNVYPFGTTYEEIYKDLVSKDRQLYTGKLIIGVRDLELDAKKCLVCNKLSLFFRKWNAPHT